LLINKLRSNENFDVNKITHIDGNFKLTVSNEKFLNLVQKLASNSGWLC